MAVVVPYVAGMLHDRTIAALAGCDPHYAELDRDNDAAYWELLDEKWHTPGDLLIVEQDIVPAPGVLAEMLACDQPWCTSPYLIIDKMISAGLGCTKFSADLKRAVPQLLDLTAAVADGRPAAPKSWQAIDVRLAHVLDHLGYTPHQHAESEHLHDYSMYSATATEAAELERAAVDSVATTLRHLAAAIGLGQP